MQIALNSKFFDQLSVRQLGEKARDLGYEGIDICVRPGHPVNLENVEEALPEACKIWLDQGPIFPLASAPVTFNDPASPEAKRLYAGCAAAGIPRIKLGYWMFNEGDDYWQVLERAREDLEGFARLSAQYGVKSCCHTEYHFGGAIIRQVGYAEEKPAHLEDLAREDAAYLHRLLGEMHRDG
jgi:sugar phosphate isomerase/epimerase